MNPTVMGFKVTTVMGLQIQKEWAYSFNKNGFVALKRISLQL